MNSLEAPKKKLFVAVQLADLSSEFLAAVKKLRIMADRKELEVRWVPPEGWHVTLVFLGYVEDGSILKISEALRKALENQKTFLLKLERFGAFPEPSSARVIWAGLQRSQALYDLQTLLESALKAFLPAPSAGGGAHPFRPHITLGRLRNSHRVSDILSSFERKKYGRYQVHEVVLFESVLAGGVTSYRPIAYFPLDKGEDAT